MLNQQGLSKNKPRGNAEENIVEFLDIGDIDEAIIDSGLSQRIMMVSANYRNEVTNTVLWLCYYGIACQCFKATSYQSGKDLFLNIVQIIPRPESKDFMIGMAAKEAEEKNAGNEKKTRQKVRLEYWSLVLEAFRNSGSNIL